MRIVLTMAVDGPAEAVDANLAFHLNAGVDVVVVLDLGSDERTTELLESYAQDGYVRRVPAGGAHEQRLGRSELAHLAVAEHGAEWVISGDVDRFWWPRGESLKDVLGVIPPRYAVVQGLVRTFAGQPDEQTPPAEHRSTRTSLLGPEGAEGTPLERLLRPVYRAQADMAIDEDDSTLGGRRVPLRAWYPIEVFHFPPPEAGLLDDAQRGSRLTENALVVDTRLQDALRSLREAAEATSGRTYALPGAGSSRLALCIPTIVDDASYAVECAAVGEVDLVGLDRQIRELEERIGALEARLWPRVRRRLRRLVRR